MSQVSERVQEFFRDYERGVNEGAAEDVALQYAESFLFAGARGAQTVRRQDLVNALGKRQGLFAATGLTSSKISSLEETRLDANYIVVKVYWVMRFEKDPQHPIDDQNAATYILYQQDDALRIVFQLDHQDLIKRAQELGLLPEQN
ncbi:MAG: hypothetical protein IT176_13625 [Acidobacteria bacterium]|nr:hypothetical protein [Acidobacteriota bacterium]